MLGNSSLLRMMGMGSQTEKVVIKGQDFEAMTNFAEYLKYQLDDLDNISNSYVSVSQGSTVSKIFFDQYLMGMNNVEPGNVSQELSNFQPQSKAEVKYKAGNQEYDILIRDINYDEDDQKTQTRTLEDLRTWKSRIRITGWCNCGVSAASTWGAIKGTLPVSTRRRR